MKSFKTLLMEGADKDTKGDKKEYTAFVNKMLKKYKVDSIADLKGEQKKKFFSELDSGWKGDDEKDERLKEAKQIFSITIKEPKDASKAMSALRKSKVKFSDESSNYYTFKKEEDWDMAMELLDDLSIEYDFSDED